MDGTARERRQHGRGQGQGREVPDAAPRLQGEATRRYIAVPCPTYNSYTLLRVITKTHSAEDLAKGSAYLKRLKVYPLASAATPPVNQFIDIADKVYDGIPVFDASFYTSLARMVAEEPVLERDMAIMGQLRSLDIGNELTFKPDAARTAILKGAIAEAYALMMEGYATTGDVVWEGKRKWRRPADVALVHGTKLTFVEPGKGLRLDEQSYSWFGMYGPVVPPPPQLYLKTYETDKGERLNGSNTYRLRVPANVPARQFWAADAYDAGIAAFIRDAPVVGIDSYNQKMKKNADGTVDIYFAPKPPPGQESNWVTTAEGKPFFLFFRFYGPEKPIIDKSWVLNDIELVK